MIQRQGDSAYCSGLTFGNFSVSKCSCSLHTNGLDVWKENHWFRQQRKLWHFQERSVTLLFDIEVNIKENSHIESLLGYREKGKYFYVFIFCVCNKLIHYYASESVWLNPPQCCFIHSFILSDAQVDTVRVTLMNTTQHLVLQMEKIP